MSEQPTRQLSRRGFLQMVGMGGAAMALAACAVPVAPAPAGQPAAESGQAFLNYWTGWSGFEFDELQKLVDKFNAEHTDQIFVNMTTVFGQYEKVLTAIAGGNPPDVVSAVWLRELVSMAARGGLQPVTQYAEAAGIDGSEYFPQFWDAWWHNEELWGLMVTSNSQVVAYQPALLAEVGADPANPPKSSAELDALAQSLEKMDADGNIERVGLLPAGLTWWGRVFGGSFYDAANLMGASLGAEERGLAAGERLIDLHAGYAGLKGIAVPERLVASMIDEFPILAVLAAFATGETRVTGAHELRVKESDRIKAIVAMLRVNGVGVEETEDGFIVEGCGGPVPGGGLVETRHDHRIAMSALVMGTAALKAVSVDDVSMIDTSYPEFLGHMAQLGAEISEG